MSKAMGQCVVWSQSSPLFHSWWHALQKPIVMAKGGVLVGNYGCLGRLCATMHLTLSKKIGKGKSAMLGPSTVREEDSKQSITIGLCMK